MTKHRAKHVREKGHEERKEIESILNIEAKCVGAHLGKGYPSTLRSFVQ